MSRAALGLGPDATADEIRKAYRRLVRAAHPDLGGTHEGFIALKRAYEAALQELDGLPKYFNPFPTKEPCDTCEGRGFTLMGDGGFSPLRVSCPDCGGYGFVKI